MLLIDVATTSDDVGSTSSRLTKVARIADLLTRAAPDAAVVAIVVSWLSGELRQRKIGVGWAALRSRPPAAPHASLTVAGVDATFSDIGAVSGKGAPTRRAALLSTLFAAATDTLPGVSTSTNTTTAVDTAAGTITRDSSNAGAAAVSQTLYNNAPLPGMRVRQGVSGSVSPAVMVPLTPGLTAVGRLNATAATTPGTGNGFFVLSVGKP